MKQARRKSLRNKSLTDNDDFGESMPRKAKGHSRVGKGGIPQANPFVEMLKEASVEQAVPLRRVAVLDDTNTVSEALKVCILVCQNQTEFFRRLASRIGH